MSECCDAAEKALDAIVRMCGCETWEYPGQVVRDVERALSILRDRAVLAEQTRDSAQAASTQAVLERRQAEAELQKLREFIISLGFNPYEVGSPTWFALQDTFASRDP